MSEFYEAYYLLQTYFLYYGGFFLSPSPIPGFEVTEQFELFDYHIKCFINSVDKCHN